MVETLPNCSRCGFTSPPGMRFCGGCGAPLAAAADDEEKKKVVVLVADICDFTTLVATCDPEETMEKVGACLGLMGEEVRAFGGVVVKHIGDALTAAFGVPQTHEDDAERAVRAALKILERTRSFGAASGMALELRVGVHAGDVIVSMPETAQGSNYNIFGDAVAVATLVGASAEPGQVVVTSPVYDASEAAFVYDKLPGERVDGLPGLVARYGLAGEKGEVRDTDLRGFRAPLVGRARGLGLLRQAYFGAMRDRVTRIAAIVGEAGIGKSRLARELVKSLDENGERPLLLRGRCLAYAAAAPYFPFAEIIKKLAGVKDDMPAYEKRALLETAVVSALGGGKSGNVATATTLARLWALDDEGAQGERPDAEQVRAQLFAALEQLFRVYAHRHGLILHIEDIHWADASTLALVEHLARVLTDAPALILLDARPPEDYGDGVGDLLNALAAGGRTERVDLEELDAGEARQMLDALFRGEKVAPTLAEFILNRAAGNPYYIEELVKTLAEKSDIVRDAGLWALSRQIGDLDIPPTVEGVLRSRLDHLPRAEKRVLQRAAVIGYTFGRKALQALVEEKVDDYVASLERRDFIRRRRRPTGEGDAEYSFKHALLHAVVYHSVLTRIRKELHLKAARELGAAAGGPAGADYPKVAYHYEAGGDAERAAEFFLKAAGYAAGVYANDDARRFYAKVVSYARARGMVREAHRGWGNVCVRTGANDDALSHYRAALGYAAAPLEEADLLHLTGDAYERKSAYDDALAYYERAAKVLPAGAPTRVHGALYKSLAWVNRLRGDNEAALTFARRAEAALAALDAEDAEVDLIRARTLVVTGTILDERGETQDPAGYYERARALYEKHGALFGVSDALMYQGMHEWGRGYYDAGISRYDEALKIAERAGYRYGQAVACCNLGDCYGEIGDYERARQYYLRYLGINAIIANRLGDGYAYRGLGWLAEEEGRYDEAERCYREALAVFEGVGAAANARSVKLELAKFYAGRGDGARAAALLAPYRDGAADDVEMITAELAVAARLGAAASPVDAAGADLTARAERVLEKYLKANDRLYLQALLAARYAASGAAEKAAVYREQAEAGLAEFEAHIPEVKYRERFRRRIWGLAGAGPERPGRRTARV